MAAKDLEAIEPFLEPLLDSVKPGERRKLMNKLMRHARRAQADRLRRNVEPDETKMIPRKPRKGKRGKMFRNIGKTRSLKIRVRPDEGELSFANPLIEHTAAVHHFGETGYVGKTCQGKVVRTKYEARRLLGHGRESEEFLDEVLRHLVD